MSTDTVRPSPQGTRSCSGLRPPSMKATWCVWWWVWWRVVQAFPLNSMTTVFLHIYLPLITRILHQSTDQSHDRRFENQRIIGDKTMVPVQKDKVIHRMTSNIHHQAGNNTERPAAILLFIQRNKYGWFEESQSMMKAIWHPESASISPQAQKQQSVSLWKITCSRNSLDTKMGDACKKKKALFNILYIFNCITDSRPTISYSLKEEDAER